MEGLKVENFLHYTLIMSSTIHCKRSKLHFMIFFVGTLMVGWVLRVV